MTLLRVRAHWSNNLPAGPPPASPPPGWAAGLPGSVPTVAFTGSPPRPPKWPSLPAGPVVDPYDVWVPLVSETILNAAGWAAGPSNAGTPPGSWPVASGVPAGTYDDGYTSSGFTVTRVRVYQDGLPGTGFSYQVLAPSGQSLGVVTPTAPGWSTYLTVPAGSTGDMSGIWTIRIDRAGGSSVPNPGLLPDIPGSGNTVDEPFVSPYGNKFEGILGLEFDGVEVQIPPPHCWDDISVVVDTQPIPCANTGATASVSFRATVTPSVPPYPGAYEWRVKQGTTVVLPWTAGPAINALSLAAGSYIVAVRVRQPDCPQGDLSDSVPVTIPDCNQPCSVLVTGPSTIACASGPTPPVQFVAQTTPPSSGPFTWRVLDATGVGPPPTAGTETFTYSFPGPGIYKVTASLATPGCPTPTAADTFMATVPDCNCPILSGNLTGGPISACEWQFTLPVTFASTPKPVTYTWDFGDGTTVVTSTPSVTHPYGTNGTFSVTVTTDSAGCPSLSGSLTVHVDGCAGGQPPAPTSACKATAGSGSGSVTVTFNSAVTTASATNPANYSVSVGGAAPVTLAPGSVTYDPATLTATISGLTLNASDSVVVTVSGVVGTNGVPMSAPGTSSCAAPGGGTTTGGGSLPGCAVLLILAIALLIVGSIVTVIGVCTSIVWVIVVGAVLGVIGLVLFILWAIFCARFTPCPVMIGVHCALFWLIAVVAPVLTLIAGLVGGLPCGLAAAVAWGGWGTLYAWLGRIMRSVGCSPTC